MIIQILERNNKTNKHRHTNRTLSPVFNWQVSSCMITKIGFLGSLSEAAKVSEPLASQSNIDITIAGLYNSPIKIIKKREKSVTETTSQTYLSELSSCYIYCPKRLLLMKNKAPVLTCAAAMQK